MSTTALPMPTLRRDRAAFSDAYGNARLPASAHDTAPRRVDKIPYGRFRNVYLYITEACQLRCEHCYMGERLERALKMPYEAVMNTLTTWRQMGGSKLTILGGEPTLHPDYIPIIRGAKALGYEHVITTSNGLGPAAKKFAQMEPEDFSYVQISLDGGCAASHDQVRGEGTFDQALSTVAGLCERGFDTRIICTVNRANLGDCLNLLDFADELGVSLVKFHVFSVIGSGHGAAEWGIGPAEWIAFYERLEQVGPGHKTRIWYQPTYARRERMAGYAADGYRGCIGRTLDRISIFPDGRAYVCSFLFDTDLHFANRSTARWSSTSKPTSSTCSPRLCGTRAAAHARSLMRAWAAARPRSW
ncbi:radical SAM protein [Phytohabitans sp. LJ34]|uniref:radical SAM protein n=1 Tax=Phytohabitans sp. LJ34 TaxID=3452217 RepID=UPI003F8986AA